MGDNHPRLLNLTWRVSPGQNPLSCGHLCLRSGTQRYLVQNALNKKAILLASLFG